MRAIIHEPKAQTLDDYGQPRQSLGAASPIPGRRMGDTFYLPKLVTVQIGDFLDSDWVVVSIEGEQSPWWEVVCTRFRDSGARSSL